MALKPLYFIPLLSTLLLLSACAQDNEPVADEARTDTQAQASSPSKTAAAPKTISTANAIAKLDRVITNTLRNTDLPDFSQYQDVKQKKQAFFGFLRPLAEQANTQVLRLREELSRIDPQRITNQQALRLKRLARTYKIKTPNSAEQLDLLLRKIQIIPEALVLAQAANESAWGTSRFAVEGNNLFGQWCFKAGCGLVPNGRPAGEKYEVRLFKTPQDSVSAYVRNLNSHGGYIGLRKIRECLLTTDQTVTGRALASGLLHYSSRGVEYIKEIKQLIRVNRLEPWDKSWWGEYRPEHRCYSLVQVPEPVIEPLAEVTQLATDGDATTNTDTTSQVK
ncbi:MAG TPA: flagellar biosynthesis protein FlgJ [Oceanospirillaceae bacterium]|nr:flagellar biosynthesis protein FlgJ [Oceanospirillaceae bacterium]